MKAEYKYCVYLITNILNNKVYIGKTSSDTDRRWKDHIRVAQDDSYKKQAIHKAIAKYGVDNFEFSVLKHFKSEDAAYKAEIKYIKKYKSYGTDAGYNETTGGTITGLIRRKLNSKIIKKLIKDYVNDEKSTSKSLSKKYNFPKPCVLDVLNGKSYKNIKISDDIRYQVWLKIHRYIDYNINKPDCNFQKIKSEEIINIFNDFVCNHMSVKDISKKYNMREGNVYHILRRHTHKNTYVSENIVSKCFEKLTSSNLLVPKNRIEIKKNRARLKNNIFEDFKNGMSKKDICIKYYNENCDPIKILNGTNWEDIILEPQYCHLIQAKTTKATKEIAFNIIKDYCNNKEIFEISKDLNISENVIIEVLKRKKFSKIDIGHLSNILNNKIKAYEENNKLKILNKKRKIISDNVVVNIFKEYASGKFGRSISKDFKLERKFIMNILHRRTHQHVVIDSDLEEQVKAKLISNRSGKNK